MPIATKSLGMASPPSAFRLPPSGIHWHRVGRVALLLVLGVIVLLYIRPVAHYFQQRSTAANTRADLKRLQDEHDRLELRMRQLSGPGAIERQARSMGMVKQGERAYVIEGR
jgi:cell division protein FtsB